MIARLKPSYVERSAADLLQVFEQSLHAERTSSRSGFLQRLDARAKIVAALLLIVGVAAARSIALIAALFLLVVAVAIISRVSLRTFAVRTWTHLFALTSLIALPALFLTPGRRLADLPSGLAITHEGLRNAALLVLRVETIATLAMLLIVTTAWPDILRALRGLGIPAIVVVIVSMTYRQLFILLQRAQDMFLASRSRMVGALAGRDSRRVALAAAGALLGRSMRASEDVYLAMQSRGFDGEARTIDTPRMRFADGLLIVAAVILAALVLGSGR